MTDWAAIGAVRGEDGRRRCGWCVNAPDYIAYHDDEWGWPVTDDTRIYEKICLEGFQSGLSWLTILRKREGFRLAFAGFDPEAVARFGPADVERLLTDAAIVRHRGKIEATIANAAATLAARERHGSLAALVWSFEPRRRGRPVPRRLGDLKSVTPESTALSKALRAIGFRFVGPTTAYAAMESLGLVNDHLSGCMARAACEAEREDAVMPQLAQVNVARMRHPFDAPEMSGFRKALADVNWLAEKSAGFVWRMRADDDTPLVFGELDGIEVVVTLSVWEDFASLQRFVYRTAHGLFMQRRSRWFEPIGGFTTALWWVPEGEEPTLEEGLSRMRHLRARGPTAHAFSLRLQFDPEGIRLRVP